MANILYLGDCNPASTSAHRANALQRLGHHVILRDTDRKAREYPLFNYMEPLHYRTGFRMLQKQMISWVDHIVKDTPRPDVVWINGGEFLGTQCLKLLKTLNCPIVLYNSDDPTGSRDGRRFDLLLPSLSYYDLCVVMREINIPEFKAKGAKNVLRVYMSYDELVHQPLPVADIPQRYLSDVVFIGTWMRHEKRDEFLLELMKQGISVSIWGGRWKKSPHWNVLKHAFKGEALSGCDYVAAIQGAGICLGLLSKGNRDLHTQRSLEVPYAGGLLCAERTKEHLQMYIEGKEAFFWSDAKECATICKMLLTNPGLRDDVCAAGMKKVRANRAGNEQVCRKILNELNISS